MEEERKPRVDHTGEVLNNRRITGPGSWHKPGAAHGYWSWRWECLECGATGEAHNYGQLKFWGHWCPGKTRSQTQKYDLTTVGPRPKKRPIDWSKVCGAQCHDCGHFDDYSGGCVYILDTGHRRPKVDLQREKCPVRDQKYKRPGITV